MAANKKHINFLVHYFWELNECEMANGTSTNKKKNGTSTGIQIFSLQKK